MTQDNQMDKDTTVGEGGGVVDGPEKVLDMPASVADTLAVAALAALVLMVVAGLLFGVHSAVVADLRTCGVLAGAGAGVAVLRVRYLASRLGS